MFKLESKLIICLLNFIKSELAFNKSKRAFESELENYSRQQKEISEKIRRS